jgi:hypothetical protein
MERNINGIPGWSVKGMYVPIRRIHSDRYPMLSPVATSASSSDLQRPFRSSVEKELSMPPLGGSPASPGKSAGIGHVRKWLRRMPSTWFQP